MNYQEVKGLSPKDVDWKDKTILIVEDVPSSIIYFEAVLSRTEANLLWAADGQQAYDICVENENIDLVLMDLGLPIMSGFAATEKIRFIRPELKIVAQTAHLSSDEEQKSIDVGCIDFISKPIDINTLITTINKYVKS
ncbi:MAG: response regulator [Saprospiraceae bacterium]|nr:response regulator [Saprospiraceae bacterium]